MGPGLLLAGLIDQAGQAAQWYRERCQDTPGVGELLTGTMCGAVAQSRGLVKTRSRPRPAGSVRSSAQMATGRRLRCSRISPGCLGWPVRLARPAKPSRR
jgi:hypothetical protein